jgi:hypothetical protein
LGGEELKEMSGYEREMGDLGRRRGTAVTGCIILVNEI